MCVCACVCVCVCVCMCTYRTTWLVSTIVGAGKPCLLVGESGTAKSATISNYLNLLDPTTNIILNINFSSRTSSADVQRALEDSTEKRTKDTYGPPMGKKLIMFLDDLNMPRVDKYGTQQPIALLKLFIERKGLYDRGKELSWKNMKDVQVRFLKHPHAHTQTHTRTHTHTHTQGHTQIHTHP